MSKYFFRMFRYMRPYAFAFWIGMLLSTAGAFLSPFIRGVFSAGVVEAIAAADGGMIRSAIIMVSILMLGYLLMEGVGLYMWLMSVVKAGRDLKKELFRAFTATGVETAHGHSGEGIAAINTEADTAIEIFDEGALGEFARNTIAIAGASILAFTVDWRMGLGLWAIGLIGFLVQNRFTKPLARIGNELLAANADALSLMSNKLQGALIIRAYNTEQRSLISLDKETGKLKLLDFRRAAISAFQNAFTTLQGWLALVLVFGMGGLLVASDASPLTLASLMLLWPMVNAASRSFSQIGAAYANLQPPLAAAKKVFSHIDCAKYAAKLVHQPPKVATGHEIIIKNLNFKYRDAATHSLHNITLNIAENEMVAFVGPSGSGKSTLLKAIIGMYQRDELPITLGNLHFNDTPITDWRNHFAYIDQSCTLFDMTIGENIALGSGNLSSSDIQIAAKQAGIHDFITGLDEGYNTPVGEKGAELSGGQRQRVAIARALIKGAPILVFDEATSALDTENETLIMDTIHSLRKNHTILIATHNLTNTTCADKIVVMEQGRIIASDA